MAHFYYQGVLLDSTGMRREAAVPVQQEPTCLMRYTTTQLVPTAQVRSVRLFTINKSTQEIRPTLRNFNFLNYITGEKITSIEKNEKIHPEDSIPPY